MCEVKNIIGWIFLGDFDFNFVRFRYVFLYIVEIEVKIFRNVLVDIYDRGRV